MDEERMKLAGDFSDLSRSFECPSVPWHNGLGDREPVCINHAPVVLFRDLVQPRETPEEMAR